MDLAQIRHVAALAELSLTDDEAGRLADEIGRILAYVAELDAVDTANVPETVHVRLGPEDAWRADEPIPCLSHEDALREAPQAEQGGFGVPAIIE